MKKNLVTLEYVSMVRLKAFCPADVHEQKQYAYVLIKPLKNPLTWASSVIESASSKMMIL